MCIDHVTCSNVIKIVILFSTIPNSHKVNAIYNAGFLYIVHILHSINY